MTKLMCGKRCTCTGAPCNAGRYCPNGTCSPTSWPMGLQRKVKLKKHPPISEPVNIPLTNHGTRPTELLLLAHLRADTPAKQVKFKEKNNRQSVSR